MFVCLWRFCCYCLERILLCMVRDIRLALMRSELKYTKKQRNKLWLLFKQTKKFLTYKGLSVIIIASVLTGCGTTKLSSPSIHSCVDMTTYVNNGKTAAQVISRERICELERIKALG